MDSLTLIPSTYFLFSVYDQFAYKVHHVYAVPIETWRGHQIPVQWDYRKERVAWCMCWELTSEPGSSARGASAFGAELWLQSFCGLLWFCLILSLHWSLQPYVYFRKQSGRPAPLRLSLKYLSVIFVSCSCFNLVKNIRQPGIGVNSWNPRTWGWGKWTVVQVQPPLWNTGPQPPISKNNKMENNYSWHFYILFKNNFNLFFHPFPRWKMITLRLIMTQYKFYMEKNSETKYPFLSWVKACFCLPLTLSMLS